MIISFEIFWALLCETFAIYFEMEDKTYDNVMQTWLHLMIHEIQLNVKIKYKHKRIKNRTECQHVKAGRS